MLIYSNIPDKMLMVIATILEDAKIVAIINFYI